MYDPKYETKYTPNGSVGVLYFKLVNFTDKVHNIVWPMFSPSRRLATNRTILQSAFSWNSTGVTWWQTVQCATLCSVNHIRLCLVPDWTSIRPGRLPRRQLLPSNCCVSGPSPKMTSLPERAICVYISSMIRSMHSRFEPQMCFSYSFVWILVSTMCFSYSFVCILISTMFFLFCFNCFWIVLFSPMSLTYKITGNKIITYNRMMYLYTF